MKRSILVAIILILSVGGCGQHGGYQSYDSCVYNESTYDERRGVDPNTASATAIEYCGGRFSGSDRGLGNPDYGEY